MTHSLLTLLGFGYILVVINMTIVYFIGRLVKNATVVDVYWGFGFIVLSAFYAYLIQTFSLSSYIILSIVLMAGLRLGSHIGSRVLKEHPKEDARYALFREHFSEHPEIATYVAYQLQGLLMILASIPILIVLYYPQDQLSSIMIMGTIISLIGIIGEAVADRQLKTFIHQPQNRGKTCQVGLWKYSRHPNYFFEWTIWCGYTLMAINLPSGLWAFISPILMLHFLINITGVKATEERALISRSDYAEYQKSTSVFVPLPKKDIDL